MFSRAFDYAVTAVVAVLLALCAAARGQTTRPFAAKIIDGRLVVEAPLVDGGGTATADGLAFVSRGIDGLTVALSTAGDDCGNCPYLVTDGSCLYLNYPGKADDGRPLALHLIQSADGVMALVVPGPDCGDAGPVPPAPPALCGADGLTDLVRRLPPDAAALVRRAVEAFGAELPPDPPSTWLAPAEVDAETAVAADALLADLDSPSWRVRDNACRWLAALGPAALAHLRAAYGLDTLTPSQSAGLCLAFPD